MKKCKLCNKEFIANSNSQKYCSIICSKQERKEYMQKYSKKYHKYYDKQHKIELKESHKKYKKEHKKEIQEYQKEYDKNYYQKNKEIIKQRAKKYYEENKKIIMKQHLQSFEKRYKIDINFRILHCLRGRIWSALKGFSKSAHTKELIGCSIEFLKQHLEKQFTQGMSWENYGKWHVDHIESCYTFDLSIPKNQKLCFNYKNLRPLWAVDNLSRKKK